MQKISLETTTGKFDLIIDLQTKFRNSLILKELLLMNFTRGLLMDCFLQKKLNQNRLTIKNLSLFFEEDVIGLDFKLNKLPKEILLEAKRLLPNSNYIGFSITQSEYRKKRWSIYKFVSLANKISSVNKVPVFFIDKNELDLIEKLNQVPSALFPELNSKFASPALVSALSSRLEKAISIDNGIMHMISLAKIPMIVLFGPTSSEKFAPNKFVKIMTVTNL